MGSGAWDSSVYDAARSYRQATGQTAFQYTQNVRTGAAPAKVHPDLDPKGVKVRESRDSDEHPESLAIGVIFDETGSMGQVPMVVQEKLKSLFGLLLRKGYVEDPQVLVGGVGDSHTDPIAPLQIGQFESDNRIDDNLMNIFLEGNGGGQGMEGYELLPYFFARHTAIDCFEKRGRKGYLFIIGDEDTYPKVEPSVVKHWIGDDLAEPIPVKDIFAECAEKYHIYRIEPSGSSYHGDSGITKHWKELVGDEHVIQLEDLDAVSETIALTIGMMEGAIDLQQGLDDLDDVGSKAGAVVGRALATIGTKAGAVAHAKSPADLTTTADEVVRV
jgi:hypothetical protein